MVIIENITFCITQIKDLILTPMEGCTYNLDYIWKVMSNSPSLSVTNDQLTLTSTNGHQTVHSLDTGLHRFSHRDTWNDTRGFDTNTGTLFGIQWALQ